MYGPVQGKTTHLESSIPLILIIILAIFIAGNFGIIDLSQVPLVNQIIGGGKYIKVAVVGTPSTGLKNILFSTDAKYKGIFLASTLRPESLIASGMLKPYDVVILQGQPVCDRTSRRVISEWVKSGGKMIVVGDACTRIADDNTVFGWDIGVGTLGDVMPVKIGGLTHQMEPVKRGCSSGTFRSLSPDHAILSGVKDFHFSGTTIEVQPTNNANPIAAVECSDSGKGSVGTTPVLFESSGLLSGKVVYMAYDPGFGGGNDGRSMFINTLLYLKNQKG